MWIFASKEKVEIVFPSSIKTDAVGFDFLSELLNTTSAKGKYILDFKNVTWFEANLCAVLGSIIIINQSKGAQFEFINIEAESYLEKTLINNDFLNLIAGKKRSKNKTSGIPFTMFDMQDEEEVEKYIYNYLLLTKQVPEMSDRAKRKIFRSIFEIYQNSVMHSGADKIFVCGQFYNSKKRMALTMVEIGRTFKHNVTHYKKEYRHYNGAQAIEWAVKSGNTTKTEIETGGLGLDLIRQFLTLNEGKLQIRSAEGYWEEKKGINFAKNSTFHFDGSIVNIEFNLRDKNTYVSTEELDIKDIL